MGWWPAAWTGASGRLLGAVEVGQEGELVHAADQAAVGRRGRPVFEGLDVFGLDQWRGCSMGGAPVRRARQGVGSAASWPGPGEHSTAELADLFGVARSTVYGAPPRDQVRGQTNSHRAASNS